MPRIRKNDVSPQEPPYVAEFLKEIVLSADTLRLWDDLHDVAFWIKDQQGRFIWINENLANQTQMPKQEIYGKTDVDCFPNELADVYMQDDAEIVAKGNTIKNKPELVMTPEGGVEWRQTTKLPLYSQQGQIVGTTGMSRKMAREMPLPQEYAALARILRYIAEHLSDRILIKDLAVAAHLSVSTLERYIRFHLKISPSALLRKIRINRACQLLSNSTLNVTEISVECGYESLSSFTRAFRQHTGMPPGDYRRQQQSSMQPFLSGVIEEDASSAS